jgi:hypothetical protein
MGRSSQYSRRYVTLSTIANTLGAWTFRVPNEKSSEFFLHVILLLIGESLTEALTTGSAPVPEKGSCRWRYLWSLPVRSIWNESCFSLESCCAGKLVNVGTPYATAWEVSILHDWRANDFGWTRGGENEGRYIEWIVGWMQAAKLVLQGPFLLFTILIVDS